MRGLGALMIIAGCVSIGGMTLRERRERVETLYALCAALRTMRAELITRLAPLPEVFHTLAENGAGAAGEFFAALYADMDSLGECGLAAIWQGACLRALCILRGDEVAAISALGAQLSLGSAEAAAEAVEACEGVLHAAYLREKERLPQARRLCIGVAAAAGAMLVILLI